MSGFGVQLGIYESCLLVSNSTLEVIMFCAVDYSGVMQSKKIDSRHELMRMRLAIWGTRGFGNVVERDTGIREYGILVTCKLVGLLAILDMLSAILFQ